MRNDVINLLNFLSVPSDSLIISFFVQHVVFCRIVHRLRVLYLRLKSVGVSDKFVERPVGRGGVVEQNQE